MRAPHRIFNKIRFNKENAEKNGPALSDPTNPPASPTSLTCAHLVLSNTPSRKNLP